MKNILEPSERENEWEKRSSQREIENILRYAKSRGAPRRGVGRREAGNAPSSLTHTHIHAQIHAKWAHGEWRSLCQVQKEIHAYVSKRGEVGQGRGAK